MQVPRWRILLVRDDDQPVRQWLIRPRAMIGLALGLVIASVAVAVVLFTVGSGTLHQIRAFQLERQNTLLVEELEEARNRVEALDRNLSHLVERDRELRAVAGLDSLDQEVLEVGVGGPGTPDPASGELWETDPELGAEAFAVQYDLRALERRTELLRTSMAEASDSLAAHRELLEAIPSILPTPGYVSSGFTNARMHPVHNRELPHHGIDVSAPEGTPIVASAHGRVTDVSRRAGHGLVVEIEHGHGYSTLYSHTSEALVREGQEVERGEIIARVGRSGVATSPHLHYEVHVDGRPVNPQDYLLSGAIP